ncbi:MAG: endolytic transglycosylase MltG [Patescibacteria group bacterium]|nr:endolytic transglycosylase MltG [Patescibacteria group bacterium]
MNIKLILILIFIFLIFALCGLFLAVANYQFNAPLSEKSVEQNFSIKKGEGLRKIAANLEKDSLIKNKIWFTLYIIHKEWEAKLRAGQYVLSPSLSVKQIAEKLVKGEMISQDIEVTIPEGFTLKKIDARLAQFGLIEPGEILAHSQLEGYLFPDTYMLDINSGAEGIIARMRENFNNKLDENLRSAIKRQNKTIEEIVIMASLIEKEVKSCQDRRIVSGIFWNRLRDNYPLQSCATIAYILEKDKWRYSTEDTKINSPYNTYQNIGLPKGPICNPGLSAIRAAVNPQENGYYFFLSKPTGETVFSATLKEHNSNKAKYLR